MKLLCLILSVYVILLSLKPCCADNDCQKNAAAKKEIIGQSGSKTKECQGCSPFFTCGSCAGFIISKPISISLSVIQETKAKFTAAYQQPFIKKVVLSIWLPPKVS